MAGVVAFRVFARNPPHTVINIVQQLQPNYPINPTFKARHKAPAAAAAPFAGVSSGGS